MKIAATVIEGKSVNWINNISQYLEWKTIK